MKIWRLEWPDGSGAYRGQHITSLLPPCYQVFDDQWNTIANQPAPINDKKLYDQIGPGPEMPRKYLPWHFGFASREAFDRWFDPATLSFVNSPQCAAGLLIVACYTVPDRHVVCGDYQALFNPKFAERGECQQLAAPPAGANPSSSGGIATAGC